MNKGETENVSQSKRSPVSNNNLQSYMTLNSLRGRSSSSHFTDEEMASQGVKCLAEGHRASDDQVCLSPLPPPPVDRSRLIINSLTRQELILLPSPFYRWGPRGSEERGGDQSSFWTESWSCGPWLGQLGSKSGGQLPRLRWWPTSCSGWAQFPQGLEDSKGWNSNPWF